MAFRPEIMLRYPHMGPQEILLWHRFLDQYGRDYRSFDYDVHLGLGVPIDESWPEWLKKQAKYLSQRRVDAIGYREGQVWIFEVKPFVGASTIGQLALYQELWRASEYPQGQIVLAAVASRMGYDLEGILLRFRVKVYLV